MQKIKKEAHVQNLVDWSAQQIRGASGPGGLPPRWRLAWRVHRAVHALADVPASDAYAPASLDLRCQHRPVDAERAAALQALQAKPIALKLLRSIGAIQGTAKLVHITTL